jgi:hypothetical protein
MSLSREPPQTIKSFDGRQFHVAACRGFPATIAAADIIISQKFQPDERAPTSKSRAPKAEFAQA